MIVNKKSIWPQLCSILIMISVFLFLAMMFGGIRALVFRFLEIQDRDNKKAASEASDVPDINSMIEKNSSKQYGTKEAIVKLGMDL